MYFFQTDSWTLRAVFPLLMWTFLACSSSKPTTPVSSLSHRIEIDTQHLWIMEPWKMDPAPSVGSLQLQMTINIEEDWPLEGAAIEMSGLWWKGQLSVNGMTLPLFYGGPHSIEIPLENLHVGNNHLQLFIEAPTGISRKVTGGTLSSLDRKGEFAMLSEAPTLLLRPKNHISGLTLLANENRVTPIVWSQGDASSVDLQVILDGKVLYSLGNCSIVSGQSQCPAMEWPLEKWSIGAPHLYQLQATLKDAQGMPIDQLTERIGVREISWGTRDRIELNQEQIQLMSTRMVYRHQGQSFEERIGKFISAGVNSVETHGEWIRQDWLDYADELGMGTVIVPRCVGRSNDRQGGSEDHLAEHLNLQDQRLIWDIKTHPTVVAFALEGDTSTHWSSRSLWTQTLLNNPHRIPVFGKDMPVRLFQVEYNQQDEADAQCRPEGCSNAWLVETVTKPKFVDWPSIANAYADAHSVQNGAIGGVIPSPRQAGSKTQPDNPEEYAHWQAAWSTAAQKIQPTPLQSTNRASSHIQIQGLPDQWIELRLSGHTPMRQQTDENGMASFRVFYAGIGTIQCGEGPEQSVNVKADQWIDGVLKWNNDTFTCE